MPIYTLVSEKGKRQLDTWKTLDRWSEIIGGRVPKPARGAEITGPPRKFFYAGFSHIIL